MLNLDLKIGESVKIGDAIVTVADKSGRLVRLTINASKDVPIRKLQQATMAQVAKGGLALQPA